MYACHITGFIKLQTRGKKSLESVTSLQIKKVDQDPEPAKAVDEGSPNRMVLAKCLAVMKFLIFHTERVSVGEDAIYVWNTPF